VEHRPLGRTGLQVTPLCLGAMMFGAWGNPDHDDAIAIIHAALDAGINFIDTADVYSAGESEEIVGKALAGRRDDVVLATKVHGSMGKDPNMSGNSRRWIIRECEASLRRLQTDYIDLYQIHRPSPDTDIDETLGALRASSLGVRSPAGGCRASGGAEVLTSRAGGRPGSPIATTCRSRPTSASWRRPTPSRWWPTRLASALCTSPSPSSSGTRR